MSSSFATAARGLVPCISRPSTGQPQSRASKARRGAGMRPTADFPCSSSESTRESRDRSLAALPCFAIANARRLEIQHDANARLFQAARLGSRQADLATAESSKPAMPGHSLAAEDEVTSAVVPSLIEQNGNTLAFVNLDVVRACTSPIHVGFATRL
jgi:hypothetical protein